MRVKLLFRAIVAVMAIMPGLLALQAVAGPAASAAVNVPAVTSIGSNSGPPSGGTFATINGSGFTSVTAVDFGSTPATSYTVSSSTLIFATAPAGSLGTVDITVTNPAGTSSISAADHYTYVNQTVINEVSPDSGPAGGGTTVTLSGAGFTGATSVLFGSTPAASYTVDSDTAITATAPPGTDGIVDIRVQTPFFESPATALDQYTYVGVPPTVTSLFGDSGSVVGGTFVQITGSGFTGVTAVDFGSTPAASFTVESPTLINATAPAGSAGTVDVTVTNLAGTSSTSAGDQYTYLASVPPCTTTIIGTNAKPLTVTSGMTCLLNATQNGQVTVEPGAALSVTNSTVNGTVTATSPSGVRYCGSTEHGALTVTGATGPVVLGDGGNCAADTIPSVVTVTGAAAPVSVFGLKQNGTLTLENDTDEVTFVGSQIAGLVHVNNDAAPAPVQITVSGNTVTGSLDCSGNDPAPADNGVVNTVSGTASGQCAAIAQR